MPAALPNDFRERIAREFPPDFLDDEPSDRAEYGRDYTRVFLPSVCAVALPRSTDEVRRLLQLCSAASIPVVPSGGRTGLAGGAVASRGELVLSLTRMRRMDAIDLVGNTVRVQAGAVTEAVHQHCAAHGLTWPVDFASKGSSQVGGNIATNAGGVRVIRDGLTRQWVLGLQVVLANGDVLELNGALEKNNTGIDLRQLFIGSEGILGIITEATLKLRSLPGKPAVLLFGVPNVLAVLNLFREVRSRPFVIAAYEFFTAQCLARVQRYRSLRAPFGTSHGCYVLLELGDVDESNFEAWIPSLFERGLIEEGTLAQNASQAAALWALRENITESLIGTGVPHRNDIALPVASLAAFCGELEAAFGATYPDWEIALFGHIGDGNLHVNVMKPDGMDKDVFLQRTSQADHVIFELVRTFNGSISAEHGIGLLKKPFLHYSRTPEELAVMKAIKRALDPHNILNPGKIIDP